MNYTAKIIGLIGVLLWIYSVQHKEQTKILYFQFLANLGYVIQYAALSVFSASAMNLTSALRCLVFYNFRKRGKDISKLWLIFFLILIFLFGLITYNGPLSLIPIVITAFYTVSSGLKNTKWMRLIFIGAAVIWIFYNFKVGAYVTIIGNVFEIASGIVSLCRFKED